MKKHFYRLLAALLLLCLTGCGAQQSGSPPSTSAPSESGTAPEVSTVSLVEYSYGYANMKLALPEGWSYAIQEADQTTGESFGIDFWPDGAPDFSAKLHFHPEFYGICGTGVTFEELDFENGLHATLAWEASQHDDFWGNIFFADLPGQYILQLDTTAQLWEQYRDELMAILDSAVLAEGILRESEALALAAELVEALDADCARATFSYLDGTWGVEDGNCLLILSAQGDVVELTMGPD